jgi:ABC-type antimicrobial peptide transport system permease subunit
LNHWALGDSIPIRGSRLLVTGRVQERTVTSVIWMLYSGGQKLFNAQNEFQIGVLMLDGSLDLPTVQASLEGDATFPDGYAVYTNKQLYGRYNELVSDLVRVASIISILALVVIIFGSFNAASLTMTERKQDIAILQTIGFKSNSIRLFLLGRTLVQALAAFLLAWGVVAILVKNSLKDPVIFFARIAVLRLSAGTMAMGFLLTMLSACLGVWMVIQAQSRQTLADQLRE